MGLSEIGKNAHQFWLEIPQRFENIILDEFVVMPNHVHGIIQIENNTNSRRNTPFLTNRKEWRVQNHGAQMNMPHPPGVGFRHVPTDDGFRRVPTIRPLTRNSLSSIINHFKGRVKRYCDQNGFEHFAWQPRFHDRIIRDQNSLINIRQYILDNPRKWFRDRNNLF